MRRPDRARAPWGQVEELLAQLVEEVSILASDHRRKKPREIPRPYQRAADRASRQGAHLQMMAAAMAAGRVSRV